VRLGLEGVGKIVGKNFYMKRIWSPIFVVIVISLSFTWHSHASSPDSDLSVPSGKLYKLEKDVAQCLREISGEPDSRAFLQAEAAWDAYRKAQANFEAVSSGGNYKTKYLEAYERITQERCNYLSGLMEPILHQRNEIFSNHLAVIFPKGQKTDAFTVSIFASQSKLINGPVISYKDLHIRVTGKNGREIQCRPEDPRDITLDCIFNRFSYEFTGHFILVNAAADDISTIEVKIYDQVIMAKIRN